MKECPSSNPHFWVQGWGAFLDLTEESVKTVGKENAGIFRARRGNVGAAGHNFEDLSCGAAISLGVVGRACLCIDDGCRTIRRCSGLDGNGLKADADVIGGRAAVKLHAGGGNTLGIALESGFAIWVSDKDRGADQASVIGLDSKNAR